MVRNTSVALAAVALLCGCPMVTAQRNEQQAVIEKMQADAKANFEKAQENARTDMYVIAAEAWLCPTEAEAKTGLCPSGKRYEKGQKVTVIGKAPNDGVWKSEWWDAQGAHPGFVFAKSLNELPDGGGLDAELKDIGARIPESNRIPAASMTFQDFLQTKSLASKKLIIRMSMNAQRDMKTEGGMVRFVVYFPVEAGSRRQAPVLFRFPSKKWAAEYQAGKKSYSCGPSQCDEFLLVAHLASSTAEVSDEAGNIKRVPVFEVEEMGDRYGAYKAD